jgi:glutathione peroxidase
MVSIKKYFTIIFIFLFMVNTISYSKEDGDKKMNNNIMDLTVKDMAGKDVKLAGFKGKVLLIVNVASKCGNTPQYKGLETIYEKYKNKGFEILGFPCNDFGHQEPGTNDEIKNFCSSNYNVTFQLFDKIKVLGDEKSPLYTRLINNDVTEKGDVKWNFEKFLIDREGNIVARFGNKVKPETDEVILAIEKQLSK